MNSLPLKVTALSALMICLVSANAATYDYTFQNNVLDPNFSINHKDTIATEPLSSPFATMAVSDEDGGIRFSYASQGILDGKVAAISFNYLSTLQGIEQVWPNNQPTKGGAYFYTDSDTPIPYLFVSGWGVKYSSEDISLAPSGPFNIATINENASPASFVFYLDTTTSRSDSFTLHLRGLSSGITAADLAPQYVEAVNTSYGRMANPGSAVILTSTVPEASTTAQLLLGLSTLAYAVTRRKRG